MKTFIPKNIKSLGLKLTCLTAIMLACSCKKFVDIPLPVNSISGDAAFSSDKTTSYVLNAIYGSMVGGVYFDGAQSTGFYGGMYTDELLPVVTSNLVQNAFFQDAVGPDQAAIYWNFYYKMLYDVNVTIEGMRKSNGLANKNQWLGEALFLRAYFNFYLVNLYGDVPLAIVSDYRVTNQLSRSPAAAVYTQIIADLKEAESILPANYLTGSSSATTDRTRPDKYAAAALLARTYLYTGDWVNAEAEATTVISNSATYQLTTPAQVFLANSKETIWALAQTSPAFSKDYTAYSNGIFDPVTVQLQTRVNATLSTQMISAFETGDTRYTSWVRKVTTTVAPLGTYYLVTKYNSTVTGTEYLMMLRVAEQYLIRAEARARQNNLTGAKADVDAVRARSGLGGVTISSQANMINTILHERQVELFTEQGQRFLDLKRTGNLDAVMNVVAPLKGGTWASFRQNWPIPTVDLLSNPNLKQTPGY